MLMKTTTHPELVKARLEDGQSTLGIASEPSTASTRDVEQLQRQLALALNNPDLALPLKEAVILLASPPVPTDTVVRGLRCGLSATETRALFEAGVPIHAQTAPDADLKQLLGSLRPVPAQQVGRGVVNQVHLLAWTDGTHTVRFTWRAEKVDADADAMHDCDIPRRGRTDWHLPGPNLTGRQVLTHRLAELLPMASQGVLVTPAWPAVIDGVYGALNAYVPGLQKLLVNSPFDLPLDAADLDGLRDWADTPALLADIARRQGLTGLTLNRFDVNHPSIRRRYNEHQVKNFLGNEADDHESNSTVGASWDHDGSFGIHTSTRHHRMPRLVSASTWAALQQPDWTRFDGLILPAEIEALQARHRAFIESKPLVVQDGEWGSTEVAKAMDVDALRIQLETFDTAAANATTPVEQRKALDQLSNAVLALETPLARHAGAWAVQQRESQASGQPSTPFFDQEGWLREIQASGRQVSA